MALTKTEEEDFDGGMVKATADFEGSAGAFAAASTTIVHLLESSLFLLDSMAIRIINHTLDLYCW